MKEHKVVDYFNSLGKLFYAVAAIDKTIQPEEIEILNQLIEEYWSDSDALEGVLARDPAYQIIATFDKLCNEHVLSTTAYQEFEEFYKSHKALFTKSDKRTVLLTTDAIAEAFGNKNKAETQIITKIKLLLENSTTS